MQSDFRCKVSGSIVIAKNSMNIIRGISSKYWGGHIDLSLESPSGAVKTLNMYCVFSCDYSNLWNNINKLEKKIPLNNITNEEIKILKMAMEVDRTHLFFKVPNFINNIPNSNIKSPISVWHLSWFDLQDIDVLAYYEKYNCIEFNDQDVLRNVLRKIYSEFQTLTTDVYNSTGHNPGEQYKNYYKFNFNNIKIDLNVDEMQSWKRLYDCSYLL